MDGLREGAGCSGGAMARGRDAVGTWELEIGAGTWGKHVAMDFTAWGRKTCNLQWSDFPLLRVELH